MYIVYQFKVYVGMFWGKYFASCLSPNYHISFRGCLCVFCFFSSNTGQQTVSFAYAFVFLFYM